MRATRWALLFGAAAVAVPVAAVAADNAGQDAPTLVEVVRNSTRQYRDVGEAKADGYASAGSCVSGPEEGAMGVHYPNGELVGDGALDAERPEILVYEPRRGRLELVGVEYLVLAADWDAAHPGQPPVLLGQHFNFVNAPNRYGLPAFYELHVWAWKSNPLGMFADFNSRVSCEHYTGEATAAAHAHTDD